LGKLIWTPVTHALLFLSTTLVTDAKCGTSTMSKWQIL
jgi:hypothetical protein